ncbi:GNAT family N-acetyltransferase [Streptomyces sp. R1]|uniref:GNAT family N-acetyltransferase n=1 Tax=Streptomyces TaxID=1883 RepID=UPI00052AF004|nr:MULTISPECIES: GNAT family N-acetyltransferase [unclassified Streptomyces]AIV34106.1 GCN5 family acetyltransferase [Streptomyces sp. CCM_MD2014]MCC8339358.1 GNAT family N-acetyltransferase [Streptomyces sp. R1]MYS49873.1 GNAT family N-acetyltransferase [Streptomyces sp. SID6013]
MAESLRDILDAAARGVFPAADGGTSVVPQHGPRDAGVVAFTAHSVVFTDDAEEGWVRRTLASLDCDPLAATMNSRFLTAFAERTGRTTDTIDVLLTGAPLTGRPEVALEEVADPGHPRVVAARRRRDEVRVWAADGGVLVLGRGVGGRLEVAVEVAEGARHRGLGRRLVTAARRLTGGEVVWAQVSAGNARSLRAFQAAGYRPVGSEALFLRP